MGALIQLQRELSRTPSAGPVARAQRVAATLASFLAAAEVRLYGVVDTEEHPGAAPFILIASSGMDAAAHGPGAAAERTPTPAPLAAAGSEAWPASMQLAAAATATGRAGRGREPAGGGAISGGAEAPPSISSVMREGLLGRTATLGELLLVSPASALGELLPPAAAGPSSRRLDGVGGGPAGAAAAGWSEPLSSLLPSLLDRMNETQAPVFGTRAAAPASVTATSGAAAAAATAEAAAAAAAEGDVVALFPITSGRRILGALWVVRYGAAAAAVSTAAASTAASAPSAAATAAGGSGSASEPAAASHRSGASADAAVVVAVQASSLLLSASSASAAPIPCSDVSTAPPPVTSAATAPPPPPSHALLAAAPPPAAACYSLLTSPMALQQLSMSVSLLLGADAAALAALAGCLAALAGAASVTSLVGALADALAAHVRERFLLEPHVVASYVPEPSSAVGLLFGGGGGGYGGGGGGGGGGGSGADGTAPATLAPQAASVGGGRAATAAALAANSILDSAILSGPVKYSDGHRPVSVRVLSPLVTSGRTAAGATAAAAGAATAGSTHARQGGRGSVAPGLGALAGARNAQVIGAAAAAAAAAARTHSESTARLVRRMASGPMVAAGGVGGGGGATAAAAAAAQCSSGGGLHGLAGSRHSTPFGLTAIAPRSETLSSANNALAPNSTDVAFYGGGQGPGSAMTSRVVALSHSDAAALDATAAAGSGVITVRVKPFPLNNTLLRQLVRKQAADAAAAAAKLQPPPRQQAQQQPSAVASSNSGARGAVAAVEVPDCAAHIQDARMPSRDLLMLLTSLSAAAGGAVTTGASGGRSSLSDSASTGTAPSLLGPLSAASAHAADASAGQGMSRSQHRYTSATQQRSGGTGGGGGLRSLLLLALPAGDGRGTLAFYVAFPQQLPPPLLREIRGALSEVLECASALVARKVSRELAAELETLATAAPGASYAVVQDTHLSPPPPGAAAEAVASADTLPAPAGAASPAGGLLASIAAGAEAAAAGASGSPLARVRGEAAAGGRRARAAVVPGPRAKAGGGSREAAADYGHGDVLVSQVDPTFLLAAAGGDGVGVGDGAAGDGATAFSPSTDTAELSASTSANANIEPTFGRLSGVRWNGAAGAGGGASRGAGRGGGGGGGGGGLLVLMDTATVSEALLASHATHVSIGAQQAATASVGGIVDEEMHHLLLQTTPLAAAAAAVPSSHASPAAGAAASSSVVRSASVIHVEDMDPVQNTMRAQMPLLVASLQTSISNARSEAALLQAAATALLPRSSSHIRLTPPTAGVGSSQRAASALHSDRRRSVSTSHPLLQSASSLLRPAAPAPPPPDQSDMDQLQLVSQLGVGGCAVVFKGRLGTLDCAVKLMEMPDVDEEWGSSHAQGMASSTSGSGVGGGTAPAAAAAAADEEAAERERVSVRRAMLRNAMELAAMQMISHPNVMQVYSTLTNVTLGHRSNPDGSQHMFLKRAGEVEKGAEAPPICVAIVCEWCDQACLATALGKRAFPVTLGRMAPTAQNLRGPRVYDFKGIMMTLLDVAMALRHLHANQLIHRDVKPANILLKTNVTDPRGFTAKLADFGFVALLSTQPDDEQSGGEPYFLADDPCGTVTHMAPECWDKPCRLRPSCDVYSFGIIMYDMLAGGVRPYPEVATDNIRQHVCSGARPVFESHVPTPYKQLAQRCWSADPLQRPRSSELVATISQLLNTIGGRGGGGGGGGSG
ncbi:hypothetical protein HXX76_007386 [Chlamydomonas incerta]|uniref:Protein kinase domain-containing protein n=1 Tax=Chlamydomonas incerta TaxID=51695 RepID=A0A835W497_CHLIN|nr:hypothetical protein HXX76_007386 [Chlamydomonas incerta]|eukprot:KAG2435311.1 hypothetical protein HXX76_007386 [Chlamydomonas incerta]